MKSVLALEGMGKNSMYLPNRWDAGEQHGPQRNGAQQNNALALLQQTGFAEQQHLPQLPALPLPAALNRAKSFVSLYLSP